MLYALINTAAGVSGGVAPVAASAANRIGWPATLRLFSIPAGLAAALALLPVVSDHHMLVPTELQAELLRRTYSPVHGCRDGSRFSGDMDGVEPRKISY